MTSSGPVQERQRLRAEAHRLLDAEPTAGAGAREAGILAFQDRFDELATWLLDQLPAELNDTEVRGARQILAWRAGDRGLDVLGPASAATRAQAIDLLNGAFECCLPDEALALLSGPCSTLASGALGLELRQALSSMARLRHDGGRAPPNAIIASLPSGERPFDEQTAAPGEGKAVWPMLPAHSSQDGRAWARCKTWLSRRLPTRGMAFGRLDLEASVAEGHLPKLTAETTVLVPHGVLDRFTARHWLALLSAGAPVVVSGLRAHDPGAMTAPLQRALASHAPIGVADMTSSLLLREWDIDAVIDRGDLASPPPATLWQYAPLPSRSPGWWPFLQAAWGRGARPSAPDILQLRRQWLDRLPPPDVSGAWVPPSTIEPATGAKVPPRTVTSLSASDEVIEVALAVDERLADYVPVVVESCLAHASAPLRFHVLARGVGADVMEDWRRLFDNAAALTVWPFDEVGYGGNPKLLAHTTVSTLDRLMLPALLPDLDRVIYLDVDLVVLEDLAQLWRTDLRGQALGAKASSSPGNKWGLQMLYHALERIPLESALAVRSWLHRSGPMLFRAFNAGVLLMDLRRMREDGATAQLLALVEHCGMNDQDALNTYARGRYLQLDASWNAAPRQDVTAGAKIIHFVGPVKPWHDTYISRKAEFERIHERIARRRRAARPA